MKKVLFFLLTICSFTACSSDDGDEFPPEEKEVKEIKLSVDNYISTDSLDYEFEILDGNGEYTATVFEEGTAKVSIEGDKVTVSMLSNRARVTISDIEHQSASVDIYSSSMSLVPSSYGLFMPADTLCIMGLGFGVGGYTVEKTKGISAEAAVNDGDSLKITSKVPGTSYFKVTDKRGMTAEVEVNVVAYYTCTGNSLDITAVNDQVISVIINWGEGWTLIDGESSPLFERLTVMEKGAHKKYDVLQIDTAKENAKGSWPIRLKNKNGDYATINVLVQ